MRYWFNRLSLHPAHMVFLVLIGVAALSGDFLPNIAQIFTTWFIDHFSWLVLAITFGFVVIAGIIAFGKHGTLKLGGPESEPQFSRFSWFAMLFAAGMGSGLVFNGAAEPLSHLLDPPDPSYLTLDKATQTQLAMRTTLFHWSIHAWVIYAMAALTVAYFAFHHRAPMLPSAPASHRLHGKPKRVVAGLIDTLAIIAVIVGLVATLAKGTLQLTSGIARLIDINFTDIDAQLAVLLVLVAAYMLSAISGIGRGIKVLSIINMIFATGLMLFVLLAGPIGHIAETFIASVSDYITHFLQLSFDTRSQLNNNAWLQNWTVTYMLWWVAWGPFVGVFIARISKGRSLREFLLGVVLVPCIFSALWFAVFGGIALDLSLAGKPEFMALEHNLSEVMYHLLTYLPLTEITTVFTVILLFIFLITSADSGTYVLGMFSQNGTLNPSISGRVFWGVMIALTTAGALISGKGLALFHAMVVVGAIPYLLVMVWQIISLLWALKKDAPLKMTSP